MAGPVFSPNWYRVADLRPRLPAHVRIHRHLYRGQTWYVLQDPSTERYHRFSPAGYFIAGLLDGTRTVQEIWEIASARLGDDAPTQDEVINLLGQLHAADVLQAEVPPDTAELLRRYEREQRRRWQSQLLSPFAWRIPLLDPDRLLRWVVPVFRPLTGWFGAALWLGVVPTAAVLAGTHWADLSGNFVDRVLTAQNLVLLWLLFPVIKALHELGHAVLTKAYGGEVHDIGVMILVLTPVPYVDASSAWAFPEKWRRVLVGAVGMVVELFLASLALFVWLNAQPGIIRTLAYNTMLIGSISTILFNANPLLRYDGYYILSDLLEIPNLRVRGNAYVGYLCERYLLRRRDSELPAATPGERAWLASYTVASSVFRVVVIFGIVQFLADKFFGFGLLFAGLVALTWLVIPAVKGGVFLLTSPRLRPVRGRAVAAALALVAALVALVALVPVPLRTQLEGVVWIPDEAFVRAGTEGFIERVVAQPGARARAGDVLVVMQDPTLAARLQQLRARLGELEARHAALQPRDRVRSEMVRDEIQYLWEAIARVRERAEELTIRSRADGVFVLPRAESYEGRYARQGDALGWVVDLERIVVRTVVPQADIDLVRHRTRAVEVRLAERLGDTLPARVRRITPSATEELPSPALGSRGGGRIAVDPTSSEGRAIERLFQVDLELPAETRLLNAGGRVHVRFDHGGEPLVYRWYRWLRQLFPARLLYV